MRFNILVGIIGFSFALALLINIIFTGYKDTVWININDKEYIDGVGYLVYTDIGVFSNSNSVLLWKFDAPEIQGKLKVGNSYILDISGIRIPILNKYPNIIRIVDGDFEEPEDIREHIGIDIRVLDDEIDK